MRLSGVSSLVACVVLGACSSAEDGASSSIGAYSLFDPVANNPSLCGGPAIPYPNNALFADATNAATTGLSADTTLNIPSTTSTALAANLTDGFSTTASIFTDVLGAVDYATAASSIVILEVSSPSRVLVPGVDYTVQPSTAMAQFSGTGGCANDATVSTVPAKFLPISQQRSRILIEPLKPLKPSTTYIVGVTRGLHSKDGVPTTPSEFFPIVNSDTKLCKLSGAESGTELLCTDPNAPAAAAAAANAPVLTTLAPPATCPTCSSAAVKLITLESLRRSLIRPTVAAYKALLPTVGGPTLTDKDLVIAWSFTTQSVDKTLKRIATNAAATTFTVGAVPNSVGACSSPGVPTGCDADSDGLLGTGELGQPLANTANIYVGTINAMPYYLAVPSGASDGASQCYPLGFTNSCAAYWLSDGTRDAAAAFTMANNTPCNAPGPFSGFLFTPSASTTNCFPDPLVRGSFDLPIMITVPNANSGKTKPPGGWPVVIFQHGITGNRTQMLAIAPTLAAAGFVTVSIDLPLHGLLPPLSAANPFYQSGKERTFDLDVLTNATGAPCGSPPCDSVDTSGASFINLGSLITSRDNLRQAAADIIHLAKTVPTLDVDGGGADVDANKIYFAGISLGSIAGVTALGADVGATATSNDPTGAGNELMQAASLSVPGGGVAKLLDASHTFGPIVAAGLSGSAFAGNLKGTDSPFEGTDTYETFIRFAQHLMDPGDPINFAAAANANHPILMGEVIGDTVVPNAALTTCPAPTAFPLGIGGQAATNSAADTRLAACLAGGALVGSNSTTAALCTGIATTGLCAGSATQNATLISGYLSGTDPLYGQMGLDVVGPITPGGSGTTCANQTDAGGLHEVVQFAIGTHGSLLTPAGSTPTQFLAVTTEMQREVATFLASGGLTLASGSCP